MRFKLEISTDNAAFQGANEDDHSEAPTALELARILRNLAGAMEDECEVGHRTLHDINGNRVGDCCLQREGHDFRAESGAGRK